jgi:hypothetical protein
VTFEFFLLYFSVAGRLRQLQGEPGRLLLLPVVLGNIPLFIAVRDDSS